MSQTTSAWNGWVLIRATLCTHLTQQTIPARCSSLSRISIRQGLIETLCSGHALIREGELAIDQRFIVDLLNMLPRWSCLPLLLAI